MEIPLQNAAWTAGYKKKKKKGGCLSGLHVTSEEEDSFVGFKQKGQQPRVDQSRFSSCLCFQSTPYLKLVHSFHVVASPHDSIFTAFLTPRTDGPLHSSGVHFSRGHMILMESSLFFISEMSGLSFATTVCNLIRSFSQCKIHSSRISSPELNFKHLIGSGLHKMVF